MMDLCTRFEQIADHRYVLDPQLLCMDDCKQGGLPDEPLVYWAKMDPMYPRRWDDLTPEEFERWKFVRRAMYTIQKMDALAREFYSRQRRPR